MKQSFPSTIFVGYRGSQSHGTYVEHSGFDDIDLLSIHMPMLSDCFGALQAPWAGEDWKQDQYDVVSYEFRHWVKLLAKGNPNVVSSLWLDPEFILEQLWPYQAVRACRQLFVTKQLGLAFSGYAYSQMKRMTAFQAYEGYMGAKRKSLVDKFGYDVKNAAHLIRLLRMGKEAMQTGELQVLRPDAKELISIKQGKLGLADVQALAEQEWKEFNSALENSRLLEQPSKDAVNHLTTEILASWYKNEEGRYF